MQRIDYERITRYNFLLVETSRQSLVVIGKSWRKKSCRRPIYSLLVVKDCEMGGCKQEENPWDISLRGIIDRKKISTRRVLGVLRMKIHSVNSVLNSARLTIDTRAGKTFSSQPFIFDASLCLCKRIYIYAKLFVASNNLKRES